MRQTFKKKKKKKGDWKPRWINAKSGARVRVAKVQSEKRENLAK